MKTLRLIVVVLCATTSLAATVAQAEDKQVVLMWSGKAQMPKRVAAGFVSKMGELAPNVKLVQHRELGEMEAAERIFKQAETSSNGIVFLRSNGAEFLGRLQSPPLVPCFVGACNNPQELGAIKNLNAPEGMITGVTYFIPYEKRFEAIKLLFPNVKSVGLLLQKGHAATPIEQAGTKAQCARLRITYEEVVAENLGQLVEGTKQISERVDLFIISSTGLVIDNLASILAVANAGRKPIFSYASDRAERGATAELAANDEKLGRVLAESVVDVVVKGTPISKVPVRMDPDPEIVVNEGMVKSLNLNIPESVMKRARIVRF
jgi:putative tryptophan/tyrosine transport system substrate-binding protein